MKINYIEETRALEIWESDTSRIVILSPFANKESALQRGQQIIDTLTAEQNKAPITAGE